MVSGGQSAVNSAMGRRGRGMADSDPFMQGRHAGRVRPRWMQHKHTCCPVQLVGGRATEVGRQPPGPLIVLMSRKCTWSVAEAAPVQLGG